MSAEFVLEVLCEEIPANALPGARRQLEEGFRRELGEAGFEGFTVRSLSTVRRLVLIVSGLPMRQPDREEEVLGPPVRAAYTGDGSPTQAAVGFARALGLTVEELRVAKGPKGEVIAGVRHSPGRPTAEVLGELIPAILGALHFPKMMRWGAGEHLFVRPVHRLVALLGEQQLDTTVAFELFGVRSNGSTVGHRVIAPARFDVRCLSGSAAYSERLEQAGVILDPEERRRRMDAAAQALAAEVGCKVRPDPALVAEHVELVEHPGLVLGEIESRFLELPEEVLVTTLRHHQKCLVLERDGRVAPFFLAVMDRADDPDGHVRRGNEWVAGARLADASFFFAQDRKRPLADRTGDLERFVFHQKLGSFADKSRALAALAVPLAEACGLEPGASGAGPGRSGLLRAAMLLKADLVTAMVGEFAELQGVVGGIYARLDGEPEDVWQAVYDQYTPAGLEGRLPRGPIAAVLGVADRLDTLAGMFAVGEIPSGSKDPFALRRAALAAVRICAEAPLPLDLAAAAAHALDARAGYVKGEPAAALAALREFLQDRVRFYLTAVAGASSETAEAVLAARWGVVPDAVARARALEAVRREAVFADLAVAFKRVRNLVSKSGAGCDDAAALTMPAEQALLAALIAAEAGTAKALEAGDHAAGLRALAALAAPLDRFFTDVLVLTDDERLRAARLGLLARVERLFLRLADLSRLSA